VIGEEREVKEELAIAEAWEIVAVLSKASIAEVAQRAAPASVAAPAGEASAAAVVLEAVAEAVAEEAVGGADGEKVSGYRFLVSGPWIVRSERLMEEIMLIRYQANERKRTFFAALRQLLGTALLLLVAMGDGDAATVAQKTFASAEDAVKAAVAAARSDSDKEMLAIFGAQAKEILFSGDAVADKQRRARFLAAYDEKNRLATEGENTILIVGKQDWPFPIPLVKKGQGWVFDAEKGKQEILNRRIGENELYTIQVCLAIVDAQREYAMKDRDKNALLEYAQKFASDPGKKNGLYWEAKQGEPQSPLGPIMTRARSEGYQGKASTTPPPYHGYYYRILTAQGKDAAGGAYSYIVKGKMIGGFAVVAYPAEYGNSGVMTFIVNHDGKVFQKNLGNNTASAAKSMKEYDPDSSWTEVKE
jgi:Protein of unknown function (DUF2950)